MPLVPGGWTPTIHSTLSRPSNTAPVLQNLLPPTEPHLHSHPPPNTGPSEACRTPHSTSGHHGTGLPLTVCRSYPRQVWWRAPPRKGTTLTRCPNRWWKTATWRRRGAAVAGAAGPAGGLESRATRRGPSRHLPTPAYHSPRTHPFPVVHLKTRGPRKAYQLNLRGVTPQNGGNAEREGGAFASLPGALTNCIGWLQLLVAFAPRKGRG